MTEARKEQMRHAQARYRKNHPDRVLAYKRSVNVGTRMPAWAAEASNVLTALLKAPPAWVAEAADGLRELQRKREVHDRVSTGKALESQRKWQRANPDKMRQYGAEGYALRRGAESADGSVTPAAWQETLEYFGNACAYCLRTDVKLTQDHVTAASKGGAHAIGNLVPACKSCNSKKKDRGILAMI